MWRPTAWSAPGVDSLRQYTPSPLGRRTPQNPQVSNLQRPAIPQRQSSILSVGSSPNASTTSLPAMVKHQQSVGYSKAVTMPMPAGTAEPVAVLEGILGVSLPPLSDSDTPGDTAGEGEEEEDWMPSIDDAKGIALGGARLEEYAEKLKQEADATVASIQVSDDYEAEKGKFEELHKSIAACVAVLSDVETYLSAFKEDLGAVSTEIESLQIRSTSLTTKLENRKAVEKVLAPLIDDVVIPPSDVRRIVEGEVNEAWVKALAETERRRKAIEAMDETKIKAVKDVNPEIEKLINKAIERIRDFFVSRIKSLRLPGAHSQSIQSTTFLRYKDLFHFLTLHHPTLSDELATAYTNTMRWYYHSHFTRYITSLQKLKLHTMAATDVLAHDHITTRGLLGTMGAMTGLKSASTASTTAAYDPFSLGHRITILRNRTAPILPAAAAESDPAARFMEYPFRHLLAALMENVAAEYTFLTDFFSHKKLSTVSSLFTSVFEPTYKLAESHISTLVSPAHDAIGLLLCIRLTQYAQLEMQRRRIPVADSYLNSINMLLWPRFQLVMSAHCESLRKCGVKQLGKSTAPVAVTQRFASLLHALLVVSREAGEDEPVGASLGRLRGEWEGCMKRMEGGVEEGRRARWWENNVALVGTVIGDTEGKLAGEMKGYFEELLGRWRGR